MVAAAGAGDARAARRRCSTPSATTSSAATPTCRSPLWRSSPRRHRPRSAFVLPNPNHWAWGDAMQRGCSTAGRATPAYPEAVGSLSLVCPRRHRRRLVARRLAGRPASASASRSSSCCSRSAPSLQVAGVNTQIPLPWSVLRYVPVLGLVRSPGRFAVLVTMASRCSSRRRSRTRPQPSRAAASHGSRPSASSWRSSWCPGRARSTRRRFPRSIQTIAADPRPRRPRARAAGRRDGRHRLDGRCSTARAQYVQTRARQGHHRRLPLARVAEAAAAMRGARPS